MWFLVSVATAKEFKFATCFTHILIRPLKDPKKSQSTRTYYNKFRIVNHSIYWGGGVQETPVRTLNTYNEEEILRLDGQKSNSELFVLLSPV